MFGKFLLSGDWFRLVEELLLLVVFKFELFIEHAVFAEVLICGFSAGEESLEHNEVHEDHDGDRKQEVQLRILSIKMVNEH